MWYKINLHPTISENDGETGMEQQKFIQTVERIRERAQSNANIIAINEIRDIFLSEELQLDDSQLKMVYAYLKTSGIQIADANEEDLEPEEDEEDKENDGASQEEYTERDLEFVRMYQSDIRHIGILSFDELAEAMKSPVEYREQIINTFLKDVVKWVKPYAGVSVFMSDLIQEGNMGLMEGVAAFDYAAALEREKSAGSDGSLTEKEHAQPEQGAVKALRNFLKKSVVKAAQAAVYAQESENNVGYKIAGRVNAVNDCAKELSEEFGRKVTMEELADKLELTYEEVKEIVDLSSNKIEYINYF